MKYNGCGILTYINYLELFNLIYLSERNFYTSNNYRLEIEFITKKGLW